MMDPIERFKERLQNEDAMKDTIPFQSPTNVIGQLDREIAENALLRRSLSVLTSRIEELESEIDKMRGETMQVIPDIERIASVLRAFYYADLTLSNVQPLLALCVELNPDIIEQRR
jgi:uncharacterized protein Yka (UPF0111/DUF47 family)